MIKKLSLLVLPLVLALSAMVMLGNVNMHAIAQQNQTSAQGNQTGSQNQTSSSQSPQSMEDKLLNYTNEAIKASKDGKKKDLNDNLKKIQESLINATGKQVVVIPSDASSSSSSSGSSSSSDSSTDDSSKDSSK